MNAAHSPIFWSFPAGNLLATQIRISWFFPLLLVILLFRFDPWIAAALAGIFLISTLLHELIGHVLVARSTGGDGDEVLLWPFGGLAWVQPAPTFLSHFLTAAGGPFTNLMICLAALPTVLWMDHGGSAFGLFELPFAQFSVSWGPELIILIFFVNWTLALVNLLPIYPLDGGRMVEACLMGRGTMLERKMLCLKIGTIAAVLLMSLGIIIDNIWIVVFSSILLVLNILEGVQVQLGESYDDSFMGYDFSQGYTSLEKSSKVEKKPQKSFWQKRKEKILAKKAELEAQKRQQEELQLDELLEKVHQQGYQSLTPQEKKFLERTSKNLRTKKP